MNKQFIKFISTGENFAYVNASGIDKAERERRKAELKKQFESQFSSVNFANDSWVQKMGADVSDVGNEEFSFMNDAEFDFAAFNRAAAAEHGINAVKRIIAVHNVRDSIKQFLNQRNEVIRRNKVKKAEADKQKKDSFVSRPSWY